MTVPTEQDLDDLRRLFASGIEWHKSGLKTMEAAAVRVADWHAAPTTPVPPDPPPTNDRYAGLYGFATGAGSPSPFQKVTTTIADISTSAELVAALGKRNTAIRFTKSLSASVSVKGLGPYLVDLNGFQWTPATGAAYTLELGTYGLPTTVVTDFALMNGTLGPAPGTGGETGDGIRIHAGSTRWWFDRLVFTGPFGDEAFSILHAPNENPKGEMLGSVTRCRFEKMHKTSGQKNFGLLCGDGSFANSERAGGIKLTLADSEFNDVFYRCPLVYSSILHMIRSKVVRWNDGDIGGGACEIYGAGEAIIEDCLFDRAGSSSQSPAIRAQPQYGLTPKVTQRRNTLTGGPTSPWLDLSNIPAASFALPYTP